MSYDCNLAEDLSSNLDLNLNLNFGYEVNPNLKTTIKKLVKQNPSLRVNLEAGHVYTNEEVGDEHLKSLIVGREVFEYLGELGVEVKKHLFVDNYHPSFWNQKEVLNVAEYLKFCSSVGFDVDELTFEKAMVPLAEINLEKIIALGLADFDESGSVFLESGAKLFDAEFKKYSCSLLDASFHVGVKSALDFDVLNINVLPKTSSYKKQQKNMKNVVYALGDFDKSKIVMAGFK